MMSKKGIETLILFSLLIVAIALISFSQTQRIESKNQTLLIPPHDLQYFVLGYRETVADSMWLRLIQDIDLCEIGNHGISSGSEEETRQIQERRRLKGVLCERGWAYQMLDAITDLAPRFEGAYEYGGSTLSIVVEDFSGASRLYEKALQVFPDDKEILLGAAFHEMINTKRPTLAAEHLLRAVKNGAPEWMVALAAKLYTEAGQAMMAKVALSDAIERFSSQDPDHRFLPRLRERLEETEMKLKKTPSE